MEVLCIVEDKKKVIVVHEGTDLTELCAQAFGVVPDDYSFEIFRPKWDEWVEVDAQTPFPPNPKMRLIKRTAQLSRYEISLIS